MAAANEWFGKFKSRAKLVQESAISQIGKITQTIDTKLKEAQEDLEKQRSKADASERGSQEPLRWQPSNENPDGKIITRVKPAPIVTVTSQSLPDGPQTAASPDEPLPTITHKRKQRSAKKNGFLSPSSISPDLEIDSGSEHKTHSIKNRDGSKDIELCLNDIINEIIDQENIDTCLNELVNIISTADEVTENTTLMTVTQVDDTISKLHSTNHSENNIDSENEVDQINTHNDELSTATNINDPPVVYADQENIQDKISDDELPILTSAHDVPIDYPDQENIHVKIPDDELPTLANTDDVPVIYPDQEHIEIAAPDNELLILVRTDNAPFVYPDQQNLQIKLLDDELPIMASTDNTLVEDPDQEEAQLKVPDDELPTLASINDAPIARPDEENIQVKTRDDKIPTLTNTGMCPDQEIIQDEALPTLTNTDAHPTHEIIQDDELSTLTNIDDVPMAYTDQEDIPDDSLPTTTHTEDIISEHSDSDDEFLTLTKIKNVSLEHADPKDTLPTLENVTESPIEQSFIKTPPSELEDSFDELKISNVKINRPPEEPSAKLTDLAALRNFILKMEDDVEALSFKQDTSISEKKKSNLSEQLHTSNIIKETLPSLSSAIPDDTSSESPTPSDTSSIDELNGISSSLSTEPKIVEKKRFPIVNCHSIPPGTKISHMTCSSTYIYLCTNDRKVFYAKLNHDQIDLPFKWQQHSDQAEHLVVSLSNRTVWRFFNKHLYSSNDSIKFPPIGSQWNEIKIDNEQSLISMSINDQCGWFIKNDGSLWLIRTDDKTHELLNVACPFNLNTVFCFSEKVGVITCDGEMLIRVGCTDDCLEGDGWIFIEHNFGPIDDFVLLTNENLIAIIDKKHHLWIHQWASEKGFYEVLCNDECDMSHQRYLMSVNSELLCLTDCDEQIYVYSDCLTGNQWKMIQKDTRLQRLIGAFANEDYVWALTTEKVICSSNGRILEKPRQAQYLTHATFVPDNSSQDTVLWSLDESCNIYVRANVEDNTQWEQLDQSQFEWSRRLVHIVCNNAGVWAVDDRGCIHFRHGHISAIQNVYLNELSLLSPAWISIPGESKKYRCFSQIYCGPADWMVYATDNKQTVYARIGINEENRVGTSWTLIEDCSALELAISEHTLWLLTSCGQIQCRENISIENPTGTRSTTLSGYFLSLTVSMDDSQVWALDSKRNLLKLDRLTVLFEK